jgi:hypothetical protein
MSPASGVVGIPGPRSALSHRLVAVGLCRDCPHSMPVAMRAALAFVGERCKTLETCAGSPVASSRPRPGGVTANLLAVGRPADRLCSSTIVQLCQFRDENVTIACRRDVCGPSASRSVTLCDSHVSYV